MGAGITERKTTHDESPTTTHTGFFVFKGLCDNKIRLETLSSPVFHDEKQFTTNVFQTTHIDDANSLYILCIETRLCTGATRPRFGGLAWVSWLSLISQMFGSEVALVTAVNCSFELLIEL